MFLCQTENCCFKDETLALGNKKSHRAVAFKKGGYGND